MLSTKRSAKIPNSAFIKFVNPQTQKEQTIEVGAKNSELVIGRGAACDLVINNPAISRKHCVIKLDENGDYILLDKSSSGTYLNRGRISSGGSVVLNSEDTITLSGPHNYPFYFYVDSSFLKKKKKTAEDPSAVNKSNKRGKENSGTKKHSKNVLQTVSVSSEEVDNVLTCDSTSGKDTDSGVNNSIADCVVIENNVDINCNDETNNKSNKERVIVENCDDNFVQHLQTNLQSLREENVRLSSKAFKDAERYTNEIENLKLELQVLEYRNRFNNETLENLKSELSSLKNSLEEKDAELKMTEARLFVAEQNEVKEEEIKTRLMQEVNEDINELIENELQCSICNEIFIEATVLNCSHLFCYHCITTWMKKKKECAVCRANIKDVVKSRAIDLFVEKILQKYSSAESLVHRKQIVDERKKEKVPVKLVHRQNNRQGRNGNRGVPVPEFDPLRPAVFRMSIPQPQIIEMFNRLAGIPDMEPFADNLGDGMVALGDDDLINIDDELRNELLPVVNDAIDAIDAIDLRTNRRQLRARRRGRYARQPRREVNVIDLRDSPERE